MSRDATILTLHALGDSLPNCIICARKGRIAIGGLLYSLLCSDMRCHDDGKLGLACMGRLAMHAAHAVRNHVVTVIELLAKNTV